MPRISNKISSFFIALIVSLLCSQEAISANLRYEGISAKKAVYAIEGEIVEGDAARFEQLLQEIPPVLENYEVYLHSPGGLLTEGIKLGLLFRKYGLWTSVGRLVEDDNYRLPILADSALCASACAIAFLGGKNRSLGESYKLGFHRFFDASGLEETILTYEKREEISASSQYMSALLANYIVQLGDIDPKILILNSLVPPAEMYWLNLQEASDLNITNGKEWSRVWLEPYKKGIVAAIRRKDSYSGYEIYSPHDLISQATFFCRDNERVLMLSASAMSPTDPFNKMVGFKFIDQEQNIKSIELTDTYTFREGPNDKIWFDISLNNLIVNQILSAVRMKVYFGMYGASGGPQSFEYDLKAMDRQMIQSSFQFCIE